MQCGQYFDLRNRKKNINNFGLNINIQIKYTDGKSKKSNTEHCFDVII